MYIFKYSLKMFITSFIIILFINDIDLRKIRADIRYSYTYKNINLKKLNDTFNDNNKTLNISQWYNCNINETDSMKCLKNRGECIKRQNLFNRNILMCLCYKNYFGKRCETEYIPITALSKLSTNNGKIYDLSLTELIIVLSSITSYVIYLIYRNKNRENINNIYRNKSKENINNNIDIENDTTEIEKKSYKLQTL